MITRLVTVMGNGNKGIGTLALTKKLHPSGLAHYKYCFTEPHGCLKASQAADILFHVGAATWRLLQLLTKFQGASVRGEKEKMTARLSLVIRYSPVKISIFFLTSGPHQCDGSSSVVLPLSSALDIS